MRFDLAYALKAVLEYALVPFGVEDSCACFQSDLLLEGADLAAT
jgi:hypothetical protein